MGRGWSRVSPLVLLAGAPAGCLWSGVQLVVGKSTALWVGVGMEMGGILLLPLLWSLCSGYLASLLGLRHPQRPLYFGLDWSSCRFPQNQFLQVSVSCDL